MRKKLVLVGLKVTIADTCHQRANIFSRPRARIHARLRKHSSEALCSSCKLRLRKREPRALDGPVDVLFSQNGETDHVRAAYKASSRGRAAAGAYFCAASKGLKIASVITLAVQAGGFTTSRTELGPSMLASQSSGNARAFTSMIGSSGSRIIVLVHSGAQRSQIAHRHVQLTYAGHGARSASQGRFERDRLGCREIGALCDAMCHRHLRRRVCRQD